MPKTKKGMHPLSKRVFQFHKGLDEKILKLAPLQEFVLSEQPKVNQDQLLSIVAIPPCPINLGVWLKLKSSERGILFDDRNPEGAVPAYFVQLLPGNGVIHVIPMEGA